MQAKIISAGYNRWDSKGGNPIWDTPDVIPIHAYHRVSRGAGDAIMLRPAIIGNMKKYPEDLHVVHIYASVAPLFFDIDYLIVVPLEGEIQDRLALSQNIQNCYNDKFGLVKDYNLSNPCAIYETRAMPNVERSRQEIFCDAVGTVFNIGNYNIRFFPHEESFAEGFLSGANKCIGIQMRSLEHWRDYDFMEWLVNYAAKRFDGEIVTFDMEYKYVGRRRNVRSLVCKDIRKVLAVMSKMDYGISVDTFGVHGMGATGVPVYGIFGPTDPSVRLLYKRAAWAPKYECKEYGYKYCWYKGWECKERPCMNSKFPGYYWKDMQRKLIYAG